ncbi:MAG: ABC-2 family transporter protein [Clostridia bacterium]|nr:ABC-2 family transporter protein [Clostridia bacterium]
MLRVFKSIGTYLKYIVLCVSLNVRSSISNKKSFIIQTVSMFINNYVFLLFWQILFNNKGGSINNTTMDDIIYLWSIPTIAFGICFFCFGGVENLCRDIVDGNLDVYLTKPKHSLISQLTSYSVLSAMGDLLFGLVCGVIVSRFNILKFLLIILLSVIAGIAFVCINVIVRLLSFWFGDLTNSTKRYTSTVLVTLTIYPEQMFPKFLKIMMYTVIPAIYVAHIPVRIAKGETFLWFLILLAVTVLLVIITFWMYSKGIKKYEGNSGVTRR